jgi:hypothetical protein
MKTLPKLAAWRASRERRKAISYLQRRSGELAQQRRVIEIALELYATMPEPAIEAELRRRLTILYADWRLVVARRKMLG